MIKMWLTISGINLSLTGNIIYLFLYSFFYNNAIYRTGHNAKLTIREQLENGEEKLYVAESSLEGPYSIFNLDKDKSKLCIGSCHPEFEMQPQIRYSTFEGEVEDLMVGDVPVGLWNFNEGYDNNHGARERYVNI